MKRKLPSIALAAILAASLANYGDIQSKAVSVIPSGYPHAAPSQKPHIGGMFGGTKRKNPFRGIACPVVSSNDERHIEGERDTRATYARRSEAPNPFRDEMPLPPPFVA
jgi:hypothetical protein